MTDKLPPVSQYLTDRNIPHSIFRHPGPVTSLEQAAAERGHVPEQVIRSIVFRLGEGNFIMMLIAGPSQVSWSTLRSYLGQSRLTMASPDEVLQATGYQIGTVSPIGLPAPMRILADAGAFAFDEISFGSGQRSVAIMMKSKDLKELLPNIELGDFAQT